MPESPQQPVDVRVLHKAQLTPVTPEEAQASRKRPGEEGSASLLKENKQVLRIQEARDKDEDEQAIHEFQVLEPLDQAVIDRHVEDRFGIHRGKDGTRTFIVGDDAARRSTEARESFAQAKKVAEMGPEGFMALSLDKVGEKELKQMVYAQIGQAILKDPQAKEAFQSIPGGVDSIAALEQAFLSSPAFFTEIHRLLEDPSLMRERTSLVTDQDVLDAIEAFNDKDKALSRANAVSREKEEAHEKAGLLKMDFAKPDERTGEPSGGSAYERMEALGGKIKEGNYESMEADISEFERLKREEKGLEQKIANSASEREESQQALAKAEEEQVQARRVMLDVSASREKQELEDLGDIKGIYEIAAKRLYDKKIAKDMEIHQRQLSQEIEEEQDPDVRDVLEGLKNPTRWERQVVKIKKDKDGKDKPETVTEVIDSSVSKDYQEMMKNGPGRVIMGIVARRPGGPKEGTQEYQKEVLRLKARIEADPEFFAKVAPKVAAELLARKLQLLSRKFQGQTFNDITVMELEKIRQKAWGEGVIDIAWNRFEEFQRNDPDVKSGKEKKKSKFEMLKKIKGKHGLIAFLFLLSPFLGVPAYFMLKDKK